MSASVQSQIEDSSQLTTPFLPQVHCHLPITSGHIPYTTNIMSLNSTFTKITHLPSLPTFIGTLPPPSAWQSFLTAHPDKNYAKYIRDGLTHGFRIRFDNSRTWLRASTTNHKSVPDNPQAMTNFINTVCVARRVNGPFQSSYMPRIHRSPPTGHNPQ